MSFHFNFFEKIWENVKDKEKFVINIIKKIKI